MTHRYTATAHRADNWWIVQCDQWPAALSQVKRLDHAADEHREAVAFVADLPVDEVEVQVSPVLPPHLSADIEEASGMVTAARHDIEVAGSKRAAVARRLADEEGLTVRDIGAVFGVSYQRAHQMVREGKRTHPATEPAAG